MNKEDLIKTLPCQHCKYFQWLSKDDGDLWVHCKKANRYGRRISSVFICGQIRPNKLGKKIIKQRERNESICR